ncbi:MAG TPA: CHRD domain-containing protein [Thermoanaerobaculia bacterium]|nr:CHRD domain-containing protein [Thermoanaerobaculia bacterium]
MRLRSVALALALISLFAAPSVFAQTFGAVLTGSQEVPPRAVPGFGNATVTFDATHQNATVTITVTNLGSPINNFHIHEAPAGTNGPVVFDIIGLGGTFTNGTMTGTFPINAAVAQRILQNPSNFYVNVHTNQFPGGAVRGQLAYVSGGPITYAAELRPGNENPPANSTAFGGAFVTFDPVNANIAWEVNTNGIGNATLSHIHRGPAGTNGPVIIDFATAAQPLINGRTSGTRSVANLSGADLTNLVSTPAGFYVNVHSSAFPGGEVRGQLTPANEYDVPIAARVTNGLGQTFSTDLRIFNPSYDMPAVALVEYFATGVLANLNAPKSTVINVSPRATAVLDDVATTLGLSGTTGALRVSSATQLVVTSRTFNALGAGKGTLGQLITGQPRANALRRGVMPQLSTPRTNTGFFNPTTGLVTVRLELRDAAGALVGQSLVFLEALTQQQNSIDSYFPGVDLANAANLTLSFDASAPIFVYTVVNDNASGGSTFVAAQPDSGVGASQ